MTSKNSNRFNGMTKAELEKAIELVPELAQLVEALAEEKIVQRVEAKKVEQREKTLLAATERVKVSREISGIAKLNIPKLVAKGIAQWDDLHKRYNNLGKVFMAVSYRNELELTDTRKYHIARSIDESGFYLYPAASGSTVLCYVNVTMKNVRQFMFVDQIGRKEVEKYLATVPVMDRVL